MFGLRLSILMCAVLFASITTTALADPAITLVSDGEPWATIVTAAEPTPAARLGAIELQEHVLRITGARLPIVDDVEAVSGTRILVGESKATRAIGLRGSDFKLQEYLVRIRPDTIILIGRDWVDTPENRAESGRTTHMQTLQEMRDVIDYAAAVGRDGEKQVIELPGLFDEQGTLHAVYDFLERHCDVRWYGPNPINITLPKRDDLTVSGNDIRRSPGFAYREGWNYETWGLIGIQFNNPSKDAIALFRRRMRVGGERWSGNHSLMSYPDRFLPGGDPELFEEARPEYFAKGRERGQNLCYTNPAVIEQVVKDARDYFNGKALKGMAGGAGDYFAVIPMDGRYWCKCDNCQVLRDKDTGNTAHPEMYSSGLSTHYWFTFVNEVARRVKKTHPDKFIATLAYNEYYFYPDDLKLESNLAVAPCMHAPCLPFAKYTEMEIAEYEKWLASGPRPIHLWNYDEPYRSANYQRRKGFMGFNGHAQARFIKKFHEDGVRGVFLCGFGEQIDYYLRMKLYDDPSLDVDELLDEFFTRYFGAASEPMKKYYLRIEEIYTDPDNYSDKATQTYADFASTAQTDWEWLGTPQRMEELGGLIQQAMKLAATDVERKRVILWKKATWDWMIEGRAEYMKNK